MIGALLALLLAVAPRTEVLVRTAGRVGHVPIVTTVAGPMVRADGLAAALGGRIAATAGGAFVMTVLGRDVEISPYLPLVRVGGDIHPLPTEPQLRDGQLLLPLWFVGEVVPRLARGSSYDVARAELRMDAAPVVAAPGPAAAAPRRGADPGTAASATAGKAGQGGRAPRHIVVIDAGHGGADPGMQRSWGAMRLVEKQVTLQLSLALAAALRARGVDVVLTRVTDTLVALADRGRIANRSHGDLFISIHVNAANPAAPDAAQSRGFETYFLSEARTADALRVEQAENDAIRFEPEGGAAAGDPLRLVLAEMAQNEHLRESSKLAESVQRGLAGAHPGPSRGVKQAGFKVLVTAFMPAVLVEVGYGSQLEEATFLASSDGQRRIAVAIADATARYLTRYEGRIAAGGR